VKIAYVINSLEGGGAALPVPAVTGVLRGAGAEVRLFALSRRDGRALPAIDASGLPWAVFPGIKSEHLRAALWLDRQLRTFGPDLIWTSLTQATLIGQLVGRRMGIPVVSWQHNAFLKPANRRLLRLTRNLSALWLADSESVASLSIRRLGIPAERILIWPLFQADPAAPQGRAWQPGEVFRLGSLGRLHPNKGYDVLIAALSILRAEAFTPPVPFAIEIAGEGAERPALEAAIAANARGLVRLVGFVAQPRQFLATLHAYLQPSRAEGLCIAAHEAMQAGLPALVSRVGEMPGSVQDGVTGRVFEPDDPAGLARALRAALAEPGAAKPMGERARARILERYGAQRFQTAGEAVIARLAAAGLFAAS
jgi:glycosyltransferase involved in cell wall biosynthesis